MSEGKIKVRNACSFPVTFYALAGPVIELGPYETKEASACLIWFSTRVKGPGSAVNLDFWNNWRDGCIADMENYGGHPTKDHGYDDAYFSDLGSALGYGFTSLVIAFSVQNTAPDNNFYFGAKKEGVYGNSDLVIHSDLDIACSLEPECEDKIWHLQINYDKGQEYEPQYIKPDLSSFNNSMFFRLVNSSGFISSTMDKNSIHLIKTSEPYNPIEYPSYWTISPENNNDTPNKIKILNVYANKWLVDYTSSNNDVGLYPVGYEDNDDQHWVITEIDKNPETICIKNFKTGMNLFANGNKGIGVWYPDYPDQHFNLQTFTVNVDAIPEASTFRIMHASTGKYITLNASGDASLSDSLSDHQIFSITKLNGDVKIYSPLHNAYLTYYYTDKMQKLGTCTIGTAYDHNPDQCWEFNVDPEFSGVYIININGKNKGISNLYYKNNNFGLFNGPYPDQLWVFQIENI